MNHRECYCLDEKADELECELYSPHASIGKFGVEIDKARLEAEDNAEN